MSTTRHCTVRLNRQQHDRILALATEQNCNPSEVIRAAVDAYLGTATTKLDAVNRIQAIAKAIRLGYIT